MYAAFKSNGVGDYALALETLDGGTGTKSFTGLGTKCALIVGFVCGVTSDDTFETDSSALAPFAYFVTDGTTTISLGFSQKHNGVAIAAGNPTSTYSSYANGSILMLDHLNATEFAATVSSIDATGLTLSVTNGLSGTMMLFGFKQGTALVVSSDTERISDTPAFNLISRRPLTDTERISEASVFHVTEHKAFPEVEQISDSVGGLVLVDARPGIGPIGAVFQGGAVAGRVMQGGVEAAEVEG
jgi:hypothetical protein